MTRWYPMVISLGLAGLFSACAPISKPEHAPLCQPQAMPVLANEHYGLINTINKEVWWSDKHSSDELKAFDKLSLPAKWLAWRKIPVRTPLYKQVQILRSPGCKQDGQFSKLKAFEQSYVHSFNLLKDSIKLADKQLNKHELEAYMKVEYAPGTGLIVLESPQKELFAQLLLAPTERLEPAPPGWRKYQYQLNKTLSLTFEGISNQIVTPHQGLFLGPLPKDFQPLNYGQRVN